MSERRIIKTSEVTPLPVTAKVLNTHSTSETDTYSCEKINEMTEEIYSTEEQVIGKWIDGKTLYRKCYTGVLNASDRFQKIDTRGVIDKIINAKGFIQLLDDDGNYTKHQYLVEEINSSPTSATNAWGKILRNSDAYRIVQFNFGTDLINAKYEIALEYTKTTD